MKSILLLLGALLIIRCSNDRQPDLRQMLSSGHFWDCTQVDNVKGGLNSGYRFLSSGECYYYYYKFWQGQRTDSVYRYDDDDVIVPDKWWLEGDSILIIRGIRHRILEYTSDHVAIIYNPNDTVVLRDNPKARFKYKLQIGSNK